ncbi:MAG: hypothetical protein ACI83D_000718 [Planctomycetota bacterium]|jgi:hypothetical protein
MITKQQFKENILSEITIIKHLFDKIPPEGFDYKPTEEQRTTSELLDFLAYGPRGAVHVVKTGDRTQFSNVKEENGPVTAENFKEKMDEAGTDINTVIEEMTDEELGEEVDIFGSGETQSRSQFLLLLVLESLVAYKMQLFLYIKSSGNTEIYTSNLWQGKDTA